MLRSVEDLEGFADGAIDGTRNGNWQDKRGGAVPHMNE